MTQNRLTRELDTREETTRPKQWQPASVLPEPDKAPGYDYRWVRVSTLGQKDPRNLSAALREGWEPVGVEEQPKFRMLADPDSRFKDNIEIGGLLLCKCPSEFIEQRREYYARSTQSQTEAVDNNFMKENDPRMPLFRERRSTTSFGSGKL
jgi:hypothetical protein